MPQRDKSHNSVKQALIHARWLITHDPYYIEYGRQGYIDLAAERIIAAEQNGEKIAVEIKTFSGASVVADLQQALGQYLLYRSWLMRVEPERILFLAISESIATSVWADISAQVLLDDYGLRLIVVDLTQEQIVQWIQ